jgi:hypothetical protein
MSASRSFVAVVARPRRHERDNGPMVWAEFYEREYELTMATELTTGGMGQIYGPAQVIEAVVGYDAAADVDPKHLVWQVLKVARPPGVRLLPEMWDPGRTPEPLHLPSLPISLILQYKRPEYLAGARAKQWSLWGRPYYRFTRSTDQHAVLTRLSRRLKGEAMVRYASPAFHRRSELETFHVRRAVLANSGFVDPTVFGRHRVWTYESPGLIGFTNDDGRPADFTTAEKVRDLLAHQDVDSSRLPANQRDGWRSHLQRLGEAAQERQPTLRRDLAVWRSSLLTVSPRLSGRTIDLLVAVGSITSLLSRHHAGWYIGARGE